jgi:DNA-binding transcriptional LysR family regulator
VGFLPELYIQEELKSGELVSVLNDWAQPFAGLRLYYPAIATSRRGCGRWWR